jgi:hypothetical protein
MQPAIVETPHINLKFIFSMYQAFELQENAFNWRLHGVFSWQEIAVSEVNVARRV